MSCRAALTAVAFTATALLTATVVWHPTPRLIWNASASAPIGLYAVQPTGVPTIGELVVAWPPEALAKQLADGSYLPLGVPLIKHVGALPGQQVCRDGAAISVDGKVLAIALPRDHAGRLLPTWSGCTRIAPGAVFLLNAGVPASFDSRYFGPVPASSIVGRAVPLWTQGAP